MFELKLIAATGCCVVLATAAPTGKDIDDLSHWFAAFDSESSTTHFVLSEWMTDNGSGGFPEHFTDEHPRLGDWEQNPDQ